MVTVASIFLYSLSVMFGAIFGSADYNRDDRLVFSAAMTVLCFIVASVLQVWG